MERITVNLVGKSRAATIGGRQYLVSPAVLIVPGVLNGSQGALYYPPEEVGKNPSVWNHAPLVVLHPTYNGQNVSARSPSVLEKQGVGNIFHAEFKGGKLIAEAWFEVEATRRVDNRILDALEVGKSIELSTGLFTDNEPAANGAATDDGEPYDFIARNYRPDHLAVLPDQIGACSVDDGCGINVNKDQPRSKEEFVMDEQAKKTIVDGLIANVCCWEETDRETLNALPDDKLTRLAAQAKKDEERELVANAARKGFTDPGGNAHTWNEKKQAWESEIKKVEPIANEGEGDDRGEKPKPLTTDEWMKAAPVEIRGAVQNAIRIESREKNQLIERLVSKITDNEAKQRLQERLQTKTLDELRDLMALAPPAEELPPQVNYAGAAVSNRTPAERDRSEFLPLPTINWKQEREEKVGQTA